MIRHLSCGLVLGFLTLTAGRAQTLTTNSQGQRVIVYPDGTTRLFDRPAEASAETGDREGAGSDAGVGTASPTPPLAPPAPTSPPQTSPPPTSPPPTLRGQATPEQEADAVLEVRRRVARLQEERSSLEKLAKKSRSREAKLANRLRKLRASDKVSDRSQVEIVNQQLLEAREASRTAEAARVSIDTRTEALRATFAMSMAERDAYLRDLGLDYLLADVAAGGPGATAPDARPAADPGSGAVPPRAMSSAPEALATDARPAPPSDFVAYDRSRDTRYHPPSPACARDFDGLDEFTGKRRVVLAEETFFTYTSPDLKPFLKDASLITCNARLVRTGKTVVLETTFVIRSQFAAKEFGVLPKGSQMTFRSVGGQQISVRNQLQSQAEYDPVAKVSTYRGRYPLSRGAQKFLGDSLLDEVRVMWGTGFDDYALYDLAFLQRQLECI